MLRAFHKNHILIVLILKNKPAIKIIELANMLDACHGGVKEIVDHLVNYHIIKRRKQGRDVILELTPKGYELSHIYSDMISLFEFRMIYVSTQNQWGKKIRFLTLRAEAELSDKEMMGEIKW